MLLNFKEYPYFYDTENEGEGTLVRSDDDFISVHKYKFQPGDYFFVNKNKDIAFLNIKLVKCVKDRAYLHDRDFYDCLLSSKYDLYQCKKDKEEIYMMKLGENSEKMGDETKMELKQQMDDIFLNALIEFKDNAFQSKKSLKEEKEIEEDRWKKLENIGIKKDNYEKVIEESGNYGIITTQQMQVFKTHLSQLDKLNDEEFVQDCDQIEDCYRKYKRFEQYIKLDRDVLTIDVNRLFWNNGVLINQQILNVVNNVIKEKTKEIKEKTNLTFKVILPKSHNSYETLEYKATSPEDNKKILDSFCNMYDNHIKNSTSIKSDQKLCEVFFSQLYLEEFVKNAGLKYETKTEKGKKTYKLQSLGEYQIFNYDSKTGECKEYIDTYFIDSLIFKKQSDTVGENPKTFNLFDKDEANQLIQDVQQKRTEMEKPVTPSPSTPKPAIETPADEDKDKTDAAEAAAPADTAKPAETVAEKPADTVNSADTVTPKPTTEIPAAEDEDKTGEIGRASSRERV